MWPCVHLACVITPCIVKHSQQSIGTPFSLSLNWALPAFLTCSLHAPPRLFLSLSVSLPLSVSRRPSWENQCKASWQRRWSQMTAVRRRREEVFTWKEERALKGSIVLFAVIQSSLQPAHNSVALNRASFSHSNIQAPVLQCSSLIGASFFFLAQEKTN